MSSQPQGNPLYRAVWRWHFYAGLYVLPFLLLLSLSGMAMLLSKPLATWQQQGLTLVTAPAHTPALSDTTLLARVQARYPAAQVKLYLPANTPNETARFLLTFSDSGHPGGHNAPSTTVYLNPYSGDILGSIHPEQSLYAQLKTFHGSLFLGDLGDTLIEIAAGLALLMLITGLFLAWPRGGWRTLLPSRVPRQRDDWRRLHGFLGILLTLPLLFFLLSGLAWTNVWGGKLVQAWSSLPGTRFNAEEQQHALPHQQMNQPGLHGVPWALEQSSMPRSHHSGEPLMLDRVTELAREHGLQTFRVHLPQTPNGVWTVSATTMAGDIINPQHERILHLDRVTGQVLADIRFADYPAMGKAMAASIPAHQGDLGSANWWLNLGLLSVTLTLLISGIVLWWKRRPQDRLSRAPTAPRAYFRGVTVGMLAVAVLFPLSAAVLTAVIVLDFVLLSRLPLFNKPRTQS